MVGNESSSASNFTVGVLRAILGATPVSGTAPLTVNFSSDGEDPVGTIEIFRWDFDGNGSYDTYDTVARNYNRTYSTPGVYNATLYVWSNTGKSASATIQITVENNPPVASADILPSNGEIPLTVQMTGSGSDSDGSIALYEWDFDNDGTYDWSSTSTGNTTHTYNEAGTHVASLRVTDSDNLTGVDQVLISVNIQTSLSIQNNTVGFLSDGADEISSATASSYYNSNYTPDKALDDNTGSYWHSANEYNATSYFEVIFKRPQEISGFTVQWYSTSYMYNNAIVEIFDVDGSSLYYEEITLSGSTSQVTLPQIEKGAAPMERVKSVANRGVRH